MARHAILRAAFVADVGHEPLQVVKRRVETPWAEVDWTGARRCRRKGQAAVVPRLRPRARLRRGRGAPEPPDAHPPGRRRVTGSSGAPTTSTSTAGPGRSSSATSERPTQRVSPGQAPQLAQPCQYGAYIGWLADAAPDSRHFWKESLDGIHVADTASAESDAGGGRRGRHPRDVHAGGRPDHRRPPEPCPCPARDPQHASSRGPGPSCSAT